MSGEIYSNTGLGMLWIEPALKGGANVVINLSGDNARLLQAFGDKQMVDQVLIRLHAFYPQARGAYTGYEIRRYSTDPSTGGAYLAFGPGQISKYWRLWEKPQQRVAFAGEHTDALYPGTLEGALRSGQRAAGQVIDLAAGKSFEPVKVNPAAAAAPVAAAAATGGFWSKWFGGGDKAPAKAPEPAPAPAPAPAPVVAPAPAPVVAPAPAPVVAPAKVEPAKKAATKAPAAKKPATPAKKPAAKPEPKKKAEAKPKAKPAAEKPAPAQ
jgi:monoamine oxidase